MPVVAVVGGIASAMGGVAAFSAAAGFTLVNVAAGLSVVGGIASALGGITGNKKLMKFGMIAALGGAAIGGINSLMSGAGGAAFGASTAGAEGLMGPPSPSELASMDGFGNVGLSDTSNAVELGLAGDAGGAAAESTGMLGSGLRSGGMTAETANAAANASRSATTTAPTSYALNDPAAINASTGGSFAPNTTNVMSDATSPFRGPGPADTGSSVFSKFGSAIKNNPELVKAGSGILGGLGQSYMQGQQQKEQERIANERRVRYNASITGQRARF